MKTLFAAVVIFMAGMSAAAANGYPSKPIRLIIGFPPGGSMDNMARPLASRLADDLGQPVIVENRPGAGGTVAAAAVAASVPDGYTLLVGANGDMVIAPQLGKLAYDARVNLTPISMLARNSGFLLLAHPSFPAANLAELIAMARRSAIAPSYASPGVGTPHHLAIELLKLNAGIDLVHVPFKGGGQLVPSLLGGQVLLGITTHAPVLGHVKAGRLRAIATTAMQRSPLLPDVPTFAESGYPAVEAYGWFALFGPAGLSADIVAKLNAATRAALADATLRERMRAQGEEPAPGSPAQLADTVAQDYDTWGKVIRAANVRLD